MKKREMLAVIGLLVLITVVIFYNVNTPKRLTINKILNVSYKTGVEEKDEIYNFKDGRYYFKYVEGKGGTSRIDNYPRKDFGIWMDKDSIVLGDLNGDGKADAVVHMGESYGGTGTFISLAVFINRDGEPEYVGKHELGDRIVVNSLKIEDGVIVADLLTHDSGEPMCCAATKKALKLKLYEGYLEEVLSSKLLTYKSEKYGFTFEYPEYLGILKNTDEQVAKINCNQEGYTEVSMASSEYLNLVLACSSAAEDSIYKNKRREKIMVADKESFSYDYVSAVGYYNTEVYIPIDNGLYVSIQHSFKKGQSKYYVDLSTVDFHKIISSFVFYTQTVPPIKQPPVPPTPKPTDLSLAVLSPNGGENWKVGTTQTITWKAPQFFRATYADLRLLSDPSICPVGLNCEPIQGSVGQKVIVKNISIDKHSYAWKVGDVWLSGHLGGAPESPIVVPSGKYSIQICEAGTTVCDTSDNLFTLTVSE